MQITPPNRDAKEELLLFEDRTANVKPAEFILIHQIHPTMVTEEAIRTFAKEIARRYEPEKIILFGSYARGTANEDSDVDMLVIMDFVGRTVFKEAEISAAINPHFALDLFVLRPYDVESRMHEGDYFLREALEGAILYEAAYETVAP